MKPSLLLLAASLIANVAFVAFVATRPTEHSPAAASAPAAPTPAAAPSAAALRAALASGDAAALQAAGLAPDLAREVALSRSLSRVFEKIHAAQGATSADGHWWRSQNPGGLSREQQLLLRREFTAALTASFGDDLGLFSSAADAGKFNFLSPAKRAALRNITEDYDEMMAKFGANDLQLASDKEKLKLLRAERDRDIAALLTPAELADYELRTSPSAATVRSRYGAALASEDDFKKIYALQKAFDEKFPAVALSGNIPPETLRGRADAQRQLQDDIRSALGDDRYAALRRANDTELRTLDSLVSRLGLPADTTDRVATARETYAAESQRINADPALALPDRRAQLQALGTKARTELASTLGTEVADAFAPRAAWIGLLQNGLAFSTSAVANTPGSLSLSGGPAPSVFPIMPAGLPGATGQRQVVNFVSSTSDSGAGNVPSGGTLFLGGASGEPTTRTMQVMSFSSSSTNSTGPDPHGSTPTTTTTVTPAPAPKP